MTVFDDLLTAEPIRAEIDVRIGNSTVHIVYDAARISAAWLQLAATLPRAALAEVIVEWDVTDKEGSPISADDAEGWMRVLEPLSIRAVIEPIVAAVVDDWRGGGKA